MTVLIAYASRHASTWGIAERVAAELRRLGHEVDVSAVDQVVEPGRYDAFVIGSAVYYGRWLRPAAEFVRRNRAALAERPVWLFSSGSLGAEPGPEPEPVPELREAVLARGHRAFGGALDRGRLNLAERLTTRVVRAPEGDFRPWEEIDAWADAIARQLVETRMEVAKR
ncbi:MAG TPA: flavodoxin domain-containing protein [Candidatus Dormibacteraeota bacterium]|nr:flavodoxin domain-containing protein [Candidatus Dormibacteraeota bacterium]